MKILMLGCKEYPYGISAAYEKFPGGGTARYVISLSEELVKKGHEVHLIVRKFPGQKKFEKNKGIYIHRVSSINNKYLRLPTFNLNSYILAKKLIRKYNFDIIHTHGVFAAAIGRWLRKRVPTIGTLHGVATKQVKSNYGKIINLIIKYLQKYAYNKQDFLVFLSEDEKKDYKESNGTFPEKYTIIYPGIKAIKIKLKKHKKFTVTFVGRLVPMKGIDKFINSFKYLHNKSKITYLIVGDGAIRKKLKQLTEKLSIQDSVIFAGYTKNIKKYLSETDAFILPSEGGEGLPCALLEAMSAGIPCIVSNFNTPVDNNAIINLENNNPSIIARTIDNCYSNKQTILKIGLRAKKEFHHKFSIKTYTDNYLKIYHTIKETRQ